MNFDEMARLTELREATNAILSTVEDGEFDEYYGPLSCTDARIWSDHEGKTGYQVWISEAAPDANELQEYVRTELAKRGFADVEVITDW